MIAKRTTVSKAVSTQTIAKPPRSSGVSNASVCTSTPRALLQTGIWRERPNSPQSWYYGRARAISRLGCYAPRPDGDVAAVVAHGPGHHAQLRLPYLYGLGAGPHELLQRCLCSHPG